ncbi:MAG: transporter [Candidatus Eisenbacteria bacterium]|nr:transporter [Candidatus Eisenbacteria bacterium]
MRLSARNVLRGTIKSIEIGAVNAELTVEIGAGLEITSIITRKSCESLGLAEGREAHVVIKATNVMIGVE